LHQKKRLVASCLKRFCAECIFQLVRMHQLKAYSSQVCRSRTTYHSLELFNTCIE